MSRPPESETNPSAQQQPPREIRIDFQRDKHLFTENVMWSRKLLLSSLSDLEAARYDRTMAISTVRTLCQQIHLFETLPPEITAVRIELQSGPYRLSRQNPQPNGVELTLQQTVQFHQMMERAVNQAKQR